MAEERRLFYVGITRAKNQLYLVHSLNRTAYGYAEPTEPSRFLEDIAPDLIQGEHPARTGPPPGTRIYRQDVWRSDVPSSGSMLQPSFKAGIRVQHPVWGEGMVLNSQIQDDDEIVDIFFETVGLKRVAASMARLEICE